MKLTRIVIEIRGGIVEQVTADGPVNYTILDYDVDEAGPSVGLFCEEEVFIQDGAALENAALCDEVDALRLPEEESDADN